MAIDVTTFGLGPDAVQAAINSAQPGETVLIPAGSTYPVDAEHGTIHLRDGVTLQIDGILQAQPASRHYAIVAIDHVADASVLVNGEIIGEAQNHAGPASDDHGLGIAMLGAVRPFVGGTGAVHHVQGDGLYVDQASKDVKLGPITSRDNKRQALSVIDVDGIEFDGTKLLNSGGLPPSAGVDFEPDDASKQSIRRVKMRNTTILGNGGASILVCCPPYARSDFDIDGSNKLDKHPIDGTDGIVPFWAKWLNQVFGQFWFYPRTLKI